MEKSMPEIIRKKRDGLELSGEEIQFFTQAVVSRNINESQTVFLNLYGYTPQEANETITHLRNHQTVFGNPARIITDRGTAFTANEFEEYCENEGIKHVLITTGVPRGNGQVERLNRIIISVLTKLSLEDPTKWYKHVSRVQRVLNSTVQRSTGAMLMTMFLKGLSCREVLDLTKSFINTGEVLKFENFGKDLLVDKHSTGGVGDKISLILAPVLAACGLKVPMISGRSLGYTGGTLDKLESIPGFQVNLNIEQMNNCLVKAGCFICGTTKTVAPADAVLYQIRDITSTADSLSLIVPSILSKKVAEGIGTLVMDIKYGKGSFFKTEMEAREAGQLMLKIGRSLGLNMRAILSEMNVPLGRYIGNTLEVVESVMCLKNQVNNSVLELVTVLGGLVLESTGLANTLQEGKIMVQKTLANQTALECFEKMLISQGVSARDASELRAGNFWNVLTKADKITVLKSSKKGFVVDIDAFKIGKACWHLGGGRIDERSEINHSVGVVLLKSVGDEIRENEPWIEVHYSEDKFQDEVRNLISESLVVDLKPLRAEKNLKIVHVT